MASRSTANGDRLYVTEGGGEQLTRVFDRLGREVEVLEPPADGKQHVPVYLAVHPETGEVWVADRGAGEIYIYGPDGTYLRTFTPTEEIANWQPMGIAFAPDGDVWITDLSPPYHRVEVFGLDGTLKREIGGESSLRLPQHDRVRCGGPRLRDQQQCRSPGHHRPGDRR